MINYFICGENLFQWNTLYYNNDIIWRDGIFFRKNCKDLRLKSTSIFIIRMAENCPNKSFIANIDSKNLPSNEKKRKFARQIARKEK